MKKGFDFRKYFQNMVQKTLMSKADCEEEMNAYAACVHDCADYLCEKRFGFVSKYCGRAYVERKGLYPYSEFEGEIGLDLNTGKEENVKTVKLWQSRENDKIERINAEYIAAEKFSALLERIHRIKNIGLTRENDERLDGISKDYKRILDACIAKGYQYPARRLLQNGVRYGLLNITSQQREEYLIKIEANYARKAAYDDKGGYLKSKYLFPGKEKASVKSDMMRIRHLETKDIEFLSQVLEGRFGTKINGATCFSLYYKLIKIFNDVLQSSKNNLSVQRNSAEDMSDEEKGEE